MAQAKLNFKTETRTEEKRVVTEVKREEVDGVTLTLTLNEARTLHTILRCVGGSPEDSLRKHTDTLEDALSSSGVGWFADDRGRTTDLFYEGSGTMIFQSATLDSRVVGEHLPEPKETREDICGGPIETSEGRQFQEGDRVRFNQDYMTYVKEGDTGTVMEVTLGRDDNGPQPLVRVRLDKGGRIPAAFAYRLDHIEEPPKLRVGARIRIVKPYMPGGYEKGDILEVLEVDKHGVFAGGAKPPYDYPRNPKRAYVIRDEFEVIG